MSSTYIQSRIFPHNVFVCFEKYYAFPKKDKKLRVLQDIYDDCNDVVDDDDEDIYVYKWKCNQYENNIIKSQEI